MDPDMALAEIREARGAIELARDSVEIDPDGQVVDDGGEGLHVDRLLELVEGLDSWLTRGGALPEDWKRARVVQALRAIENGEHFRIPEDAAL